MNPHDPNWEDQDSDALLLKNMKQELDRSCAALDGHTVSRLNAMRHKALDQKLRKRSPMLLPFGGLVTASALVFTITLFPGPGSVTDTAPANSALEDIEILAAGENIEFYEDYEFYQWLATNASTP